MKKKHFNKKTSDNAPASEKILDLLNTSAKPMSIDEIMKLGRIPRKDKKNILACLHELSEQKMVFKPLRGQWASTASMETVEGHFGALLNGGGFVKSAKNNNEEFFIHPDDVNGAWNNDLVRIAILQNDGQPRGKARRARVLQIIDRALENIPVKIVRRHGQTLLCKPVDGRLHFDVSVSFDAANMPAELRPGHLILVAPEKHLAANLYDARFIEILGRENDVAVQEDIVKLNHDVPREFPALALEEAANLPEEPGALDLEGREDMSDVPFVTIDGADARDFDDAIQVSRMDSGWLLRVAIADVSYYVRPDGKAEGLDAEAQRRGNSWYFPTSVEPMLPKSLSNGLCSLAPGKKRLAVLAEIPFNDQGEPGKPRFAPIVMRSFARLVYEDVQHFFDTSKLVLREGQKKHEARERSLCSMLRDAHGLYKILADARKRRGTLDFDLPEPKYGFDPEGKITDVRIAERNDAHKLIEEFMIAANEAVARHLGSTRIPFLYRVHPEPEETKLLALVATLEATSVESLPPGIIANGKPAADILQKILARAANTPAEYVVNRLCLRAMPQARYQPENVGHFGLASKAYCHFTSPIRRYADLLTHRALKMDLGIPVGQIPSLDDLNQIGNQLNTMERKAMECEREMSRRMGCLLLRYREGEVFDATVSGVTDFGIFVELSSMPLEGLIRLDDLTYDWFELDSRTQRLSGIRSGQIWELGKPVRVRLENADLARLELRFLPAKVRVSNEKRPRKGRPGERSHEQPHAQKRKARTYAPDNKAHKKQGSKKQDAKGSIAQKRSAGRNNRAKGGKHGMKD